MITGEPIHSIIIIKITGETSFERAPVKSENTGNAEIITSSVSSILNLIPLLSIELLNLRNRLLPDNAMVDQRTIPIISNDLIALMVKMKTI